MKSILTNIGKKKSLSLIKKTMQFWKDAFDDLFSNNKKED
jgi:hypothetical protein